jgi:hypothetical protein
LAISCPKRCSDCFRYSQSSFSGPVARAFVTAAHQRSDDGGTEHSTAISYPIYPSPLGLADDLGPNTTDTSPDATAELRADVACPNDAYAFHVADD